MLTGDPETDLFRRQARVAARHTLPFFRADPLHGLFSTVPIKIGDRCFLLTAGHCLDDAVRMQDGRQWLLGAPLVRTSDHDEIVSATNIPMRVGGVSAATGMVDAGVAEVFAVNEESESLFATAAVPLDLIRVVTSAQLGEDRHVVITGYPGEASTGIGGTMLTPMCCAGLVADGLEEPAPFPQRTWRIDVALPLDRVRNAYGAAGSLPSLAGVSGGGYWIDDDGALLLVGTHAASVDDEHVLGSERYRFAFGSTLHPHLGIIAQACPDLRDEIFQRWPSVKDFPLPEPERLWALDR